MSYNVIFSSRASAKLADLYVYIAEKAGEQTAERFVEGINQSCNGLETFPHRGTRRDDIYSGLRTIGYKRRCTIAFVVSDDKKTVVIQGVFYGGQDFERYLELEADEE